MQRNPHLTLNIVGDGPQKDEIVCFLESNKLSNVNMLGRIWSNQLDTIISSSLMLIVPSEWYEPNPYVVLQAYENEIPVIASNIGGLPDMVQENKTGLLFKMGDFIELSDKIQLLYKDEELRIRLGKNGRSFLENYKPEKFYSYHIDLYQKLLKKKI
jgi:glycosyltransferase involved in cell wall biosynthesis